VAVSEWAPPVNVATVRLAEPPERVTVPSNVAPSLKATLPEGVPVPGGTAWTVAERVTDWPLREGFGDVVKVVWVAVTLTTCVTIAETLGLKLVSQG
jgi:hypothetical protein